MIVFKKTLALLLVWTMIMSTSVSSFAQTQGTVIPGAGDAIEETVLDETGEQEDEKGQEDSDNPEDGKDLEDEGNPEDKEDNEDTEDGEEPGSGEETDELSEQELQPLEIEEDEEDDDSEQKASQATEASLVRYNLGTREIKVAPAGYEGAADDYFNEDGSYIIYLGKDPFFPYEIQFSYEDKVETKWFMSQDDKLEIAGHVFSVRGDFSGDAVTRMSFNIGGETVIIYPESKVFTNNPGDASISDYYDALQASDMIELTVDLSNFSPIELTMVSLNDIFKGDKPFSETDKVAWCYFDRANGNDEYILTSVNDRINLLYHNKDNGELAKWNLYIIKGEHIDYDSIHYRVSIKLPDFDFLSKHFGIIDDETQEIVPIALDGITYNQPSKGEYGYDKADFWSYNEVYDKRYTGSNGVIKLNLIRFASHFSKIKVYKAFMSETLEDAMKGEDITSYIWGDDATGYKMERPQLYLSIISYDNAGSISGFFNVLIEIDIKQNILVYFSFRDKNNINYNNSGTIDTEGGITTHIEKLKKGDKVSDVHRVYIEKVLYAKGELRVFVGHYSTLAEAIASGEQNDITNILFDKNKGYITDFSQPVYLTFFDEDFSYKYILIIQEKDDDFSWDDTVVYFYGLVDNEGNNIKPLYFIPRIYDSLGDFGCPVIMVGSEVDTSCIAPVFYVSNGGLLYSEGNTTGQEEVSGASFHDFSKGAVHYTASARDKSSFKNYWLTVLKAHEGAGKLSIIGAGVEDSDYYEENGIIYLNKEVISHSYDYIHDIFVANIGMESLNDLKTELVSEQLELDSFWTLKSILPGYQAVLDGDYESKNPLDDLINAYKYQDSLNLPNIARIRIKLKDRFTEKKDIKGTLTIKSGDTVLMVINLTGTRADLDITTKTIPAAVQYVPYGSVIQNNFKSYIGERPPKYSWTGNLPDGMELKGNGELYGIPRETGNFSFEVTVEYKGSIYDNYDYSGKATKEFTLTVKDNTDTHVNKSTDKGYDVQLRLYDIILSGTGATDMTVTQDFKSKGLLEDLVGVWLDGELLPVSDYTKTSGSTIITVKNQVLTDRVNSVKGRHTFALEYRDYKGELKRAAQNYYIKEKKSDSSGGGNGGGGNSGGGNAGGNTGNNGGGNGGGIGFSVPGFAGNRLTNTNQNTASAPAFSEIPYMIQPGDTLGKIAQKYLGSPNLWRQIYEDNKLIIRNPNLIFVGQIIIVRIAAPDAVSGSPVSAVPASGTNANSNRRTYTVVEGDSLFIISRKVYGASWQWMKIYEANRNIIANPARIRVGQVFVIPDP